MEAQSVILGIIIIALSTLFVTWPFINLSREERGAQSRQQLGEMDILIARREAIYATIRELDFDFETGKMTEDDYHTEREAWVDRGVNVLKAIDALHQQVGDMTPVAEIADSMPGEGEPANLDAQIEAAVAARRRSA
jgi:hypothetical protein